MTPETEKNIDTAPPMLPAAKGGTMIHDPLCSKYRGGHCDYDCARDYPQKRAQVAAAIANMTPERFGEWAANGKTYPNSYQSEIDRVFADADRVFAALGRMVTVAQHTRIEPAEPVEGRGDAGSNPAGHHSSLPTNGVAVTDAMVHAYKHAFGEYMDKTEFGHITPPTPDVGFHATKYALGVALAPGTQAVPDMVEVPREPTKAMLDAVSGMSVSGPYLGSNEARDIWDVMLTLAAQAAPDDDDRDLDLDAFHREVWGWLLKRGLVTNDEAEWDGFTTVIEEHEQEIEAAASRAAASDLTALQAENERLRAAIKHEIHHNLILFTKVRELETEQARWTNAVAVTVPGVFPQDYVVRSPCDLAPPRPDVLYVDGAVYRRETAAEASR